MKNMKAWKLKKKSFINVPSFVRVYNYARCYFTSQIRNVEMEIHFQRTFCRWQLRGKKFNESKIKIQYRFLLRAGLLLTSLSTKMRYRSSKEYAYNFVGAKLTPLRRGGITFSSPLLASADVLSLRCRWLCEVRALCAPSYFPTETYITF